MKRGILLGMVVAMATASAVMAKENKKSTETQKKNTESSAAQAPETLRSASDSNQNQPEIQELSTNQMVDALDKNYMLAQNLINGENQLPTEVNR